MSSEAAVRLRGVTKDYPLAGSAPGGVKDLLLHLPRHLRALRRRRTVRALDDVSFEVARGECFGIVGRNGSGKSTVLGLIAGVLRPTAGTVETRGRVFPLLELGAGFQPDLTGRDNILLNGVLLGMTRRQVLERMDGIIAFSGLGEFISQPVRSYSSGMLARLGFSVVAHLDPEILLIDEVLAVGDAEFQDKCLKRIQEFRAAGKTLVFVSHNLAVVREICDRAAVLDQGRLVAVGPAADAAEAYTKLLHGG